MLCITCADVIEREFLITADMEGRNIYQLGLGEGRIVRLMRGDVDRRPLAVAFDELRRVMYWTNVAAASIVSQPLTKPIVIARPTTIYAAGINILAASVTFCISITCRALGLFRLFGRTGPHKFRGLTF